MIVIIDYVVFVLVNEKSYDELGQWLAPITLDPEGLHAYKFNQRSKGHNGWHKILMVWLHWFQSNGQYKNTFWQFFPEFPVFQELAQYFYT